MRSQKIVNTVLVLSVLCMGIVLTTTLSHAFTCGTDTITDADGNTYKTVQIGEQCWMATNLNVGTMLFSPSIEPSDNGIVEKWCTGTDGNNHLTSGDCATSYGGFYAWNEVMNYSTAEGSQGICPSDWHIPTDKEWYKLENGLASGDCLSTRLSASCAPAGTALKSGGSSSFEGLLTGYRDTTGSLEFSVGEFKGSMTSEALIKSIETKGIIIPDANTSVERLNKLLERQDLYLYKFMAKLPDKVTDLISRLEQGQKLKPSEIIRLNRLIISANYPLKTPKSNDISGSYYYHGMLTAYWSSSMSGSSAWLRNLYLGYSSVGRSSFDQAYGLSVRCLKD